MRERLRLEIYVIRDGVFFSFVRDLVTRLLRFRTLL